MMVERKKAKRTGRSYYVAEPNLMDFIEEDKNIGNREVMRRGLCIE